ncbi:putative pterin-4-alpha-carbinolamine dehydratase, partial [Lachnellula subtilissima]
MSISSTSAIPNPTPIQPIFSPTYSQSQGTQELSTLLRPKGKWRLVENGRGIESVYGLGGLRNVGCEFMDTVASECVVQKHHPEWSNVYNTAFIRWTTHSPPGLSEKDMLMARFCDEVAGRCGEVEDVGVDVLEG